MAEICLFAGILEKIVRENGAEKDVTAAELAPAVAHCGGHVQKIDTFPAQKPRRGLVWKGLAGAVNFLNA